MKAPVNLAERKHPATTLLITTAAHAAVRPLADQPAPDLDGSHDGQRSPAPGHDFSRVQAEAVPCPLSPGRCPFGGACHACPPSLQAKPAVARPRDQYEQEADRAADRVGDGRAVRLQRRAAGPADLGTVPPIVHEVLRAVGRPLDPADRAFFERRFGHDFGGVRVHADAQAAESARAVKAKAYTVARDVVFGPDNYKPHTPAGRRLIGHELTHVVQQSRLASAVPGSLPVGPAHSPAEQQARANARFVENTLPLQADPAPGALLAREEGGETPTPAASVWKTEQICDRESRENVDFPNTAISRVRIDVGNIASGMTLEWRNPRRLALPTGPYPTTPGAGACCRDCNDPAVSQTTDTLCTPKGGSWPVLRKACQLSDTDWAKNPTCFQRSTIAIHSGPRPGSPPRPGYPASHGCVRTTEEASRIIHDNSVYSERYAADRERGRPERRTFVEVSGTWSGPYCYQGRHLRRRSVACAPSPGKSKGQPKQQSSGQGPQAEDQSAPSEPVAMFGAPGSSEEPQDGPGPLV